MVSAWLHAHYYPYNKYQAFIFHAFVHLSVAHAKNYAWRRG